MLRTLCVHVCACTVYVCDGVMTDMDRAVSAADGEESKNGPGCVRYTCTVRIRKKEIQEKVSENLSLPQRSGDAKDRPMTAAESEASSN